jgi:hypothetical protein
MVHLLHTYRHRTKEIISLLLLEKWYNYYLIITLLLYSFLTLKNKNWKGSAVFHKKEQTLLLLLMYIHPSIHPLMFCHIMTRIRWIIYTIKNSLKTIVRFLYILSRLQHSRNAIPRNFSRFQAVSSGWLIILWIGDTKYPVVQKWALLHLRIRFQVSENTYRRKSFDVFLLKSA